jgi:hypothetical protein
MDVFGPQKKPILKGTSMERRETAVWLGRALSSDQVVLQAVLQLVHVVGVQQQVIQALLRKQAGLPLDPNQVETLALTQDKSGRDMLQRLEEIETSLQPVLKAVEEACAVLEKEL